MKLGQGAVGGTLLADRAADNIRAGGEFEDRTPTRNHGSAVDPPARRQSNRMTDWRMTAPGRKRTLAAQIRTLKRPTKRYDHYGI
jgi:hypothetical protein